MYKWVGHSFLFHFCALNKSQPFLVIAKDYDFIQLCLDYSPCTRMNVALENTTGGWKKYKWDELHFLTVCPAVYYSVTNSLLKCT